MTLFLKDNTGSNLVPRRWYEAPSISIEDWDDGLLMTQKHFKNFKLNIYVLNRVRSCSHYQDCIKTLALVLCFKAFARVDDLQTSHQQWK
jgi:hypothetical protein